MMKTTTIILTAVFCLIFFNSTACDCVGQIAIKEEIKRSNAVFVGIVLRKEYITLTDYQLKKISHQDSTINRSPIYEMTIACYDLLVEDIYKGKISRDTIKIFTGVGGGDCGFRFEIGEKYVVYGMKETYFGQVYNDFDYPKGKNIFWTHICLRTKNYDQNEIEEIEKVVRKKKRI